jgi:hypothetical protein
MAPLNQVPRYLGRLCEGVFWLRLILIGMSQLAAAAETSAQAPSPGGAEAQFNETLLPILTKHCSSCHAGTSPANGLSVQSLAGVLKGGKHGPAITPGNASQSLLVQYLRGERTPKMPLGKDLAQTEIEQIAAAITHLPAVPLETKKPDSHWTWLGTKPVVPAVPKVKNTAWVKNPIDAFVLARLEAQQWTPAPAAGRRALARRLYFDLIGLPPTPEEMRAFVNDPAQDVVPKLIDRLLADPRYGERWGRHWLDLVRFAESDGFAIDSERPTAWRYRDYVIRSFNRDKPYDLFIKEQLAGDELPGAGDADEPNARSERLVALGLLRLGPWEADANFATQLRQDFLNENANTISSVFLGLTVGCARCHNHKYDPIPQQDFYRLQAFLAPMRTDDRTAPFLKSENPAEMKRRLRASEDAAEQAAEQLRRLEAGLKEKFLAAKGLKADDKKADDLQKVLRDKMDTTFTVEERSQYEKVRDHARQLGEEVPRYRPVAYAVADVAPPHVPALPDTYILAGGELSAKGDKVEPGFPQCVAGTSEPAKVSYVGGSSGRRKALAEWIASAENPLTARVIVNRVWQHHFGEGLVRTPSDFGINGDRPTHPELLDFLATQFVQQKWSLKALHRLILASNTYQQSTEHPQSMEYSERDGGNKLLWRMNWMRQEFEAIRDTLLKLSGRLEPSAGGPGVFVDIPSDLAEGFEFFKWFPSDEQAQRRRTIYTFQRRSITHPMSEVFDGANMSESCSRRSVTVGAPQVFNLLNSEFTHREARHFAERLLQAGTDASRQVDEAFWLALGREPSSKERREALQFIKQSREPVEGLTQLAVVLFNLNEFLYLE